MAELGKIALDGGDIRKNIWVTVTVTNPFGAFRWRLRPRTLRSRHNLCL